MKTIILATVLTLASLSGLKAQTREELERQRQELKKEIEQTEKLLKNTKIKKTRFSLVDLQGVTVHSARRRWRASQHARRHKRPLR